MAHSHKSIRDYARNRTHPNIDNEVISQQLEKLVKPCVYNQLAYYRLLGMRERILGLPLMLAAVLSLNQDLRIVKSPRPKRVKPPLNLSPFPT